MDSLTQAMSRVKTSLDATTKQLSSRVEAIERDLVEPLDVFTRHYKQETAERLKEATAFWAGLHHDRTQMLFAKENFYVQMHQMQNQLQQYVVASE